MWACRIVNLTVAEAFRGDVSNYRLQHGLRNSRLPFQYREFQTPLNGPPLWDDSFWIDKARSTGAEKIKGDHSLLRQSHLIRPHLPNVRTLAWNLPQYLPPTDQCVGLSKAIGHRPPKAALSSYKARWVRQPHIFENCSRELPIDGPNCLKPARRPSPVVMINSLEPSDAELDALGLMLCV